MNEAQSVQTAIPDSPSEEFAARAPLKAMVIAADDESALRARHLLDRLATKLGPGLAPTHCVWKFDLLTSTILRELATHEAVQADLVIVAPETPADLPPEVKMLFERWVREGRKGVVILSERADWERRNGDGPSEPGPVLNYFRQLSTDWGFDFFCDAEGQPGFAHCATPAAPLLPEGNHDWALLVKHHATTPTGLVQQSMRAAGRTGGKRRL